MAEQLTSNKIGADIAACLGFFTRLPAAKLGFGEANFAEALLNLGHALKAQGKPDEARSCWKQALDVKPELAQGYFEQAAG